MFHFPTNPARIDFAAPVRTDRGVPAHVPTIPGVTYQVRHNGDTVRVEREGKGGHLTLVRRDGWGGWDVIDRSGNNGVVGHIVRMCREPGDFCCERPYGVVTVGKLDFTADNGVRQPEQLLADAPSMIDAFGEATLYWIL